jgi:hypothetical protein
VLPIVQTITLAVVIALRYTQRVTSAAHPAQPAAPQPPMGY